MASDFIAPLPDRSVVSVTGVDAAKLLQGLITNDLDTLTRDGAALHAGLLSPQGKILFDFFVLRTSTGILIDVAREKAADLIKRLTLYKLRADVELRDVADDYTVFALWGPSPPTETQSPLIFADPRTSAMGLRVLADENLISKLHETPDIQRATERDYDRLRISIAVPEGGKDYDYGDAYPHEANFDQLHGASFTKGCYVGQEIVARMQNKSVVRKRVVKVEGAGPLTPRTDILLGETPIGRVGTVDGRHALALVRLDRAAEASDRQITLTSGGVDVTIDATAVADYRKAADAHKARSGGL